jgi:hypothetical protein
VGEILDKCTQSQTDLSNIKKVIKYKRKDDGGSKVRLEDLDDEELQLLSPNERFLLSLSNVKSKLAQLWANKRTGSPLKRDIINSALDIEEESSIEEEPGSSRFLKRRSVMHLQGQYISPS